MENTEQDKLLVTGVTLLLEKGPYQNNGASPWYVTLELGTPAPGTDKQMLKFAVDSGTNFNWVTSSLCGDGCKHYGGQQFNINDSTTFQWIDKNTSDYSFGPWGTMQIKKGDDLLTVTENTKPRMEYSLAVEYSGQQFEELDWDGGIAIPSGADNSGAANHPALKLIRGVVRAEDDYYISLFEALLNENAIDPNVPFITFDTSPAPADSDCISSGSVAFGTVDHSYADSLEYLFLPFKDYGQNVQGLSYLWTSELQEIAVGDTPLSALTPNTFFCLDTGSSQFKGDTQVMTSALNLINADLRDTGQYPDVNIKLTTGNGVVGHLVVPPEIYNVEIQAGEFAGRTFPQFNPMCVVDGLILVGSVLMDYLHTVYEYKVEKHPVGYKATPVGMWIFNKPGNVKVIQNTQSAPASIFSR